MTTAAPKPATTWRVFAAFATLAVVAGAFGFVALAKSGEVAPSVVLDPAFTVRELPFGFVPRFAAELPFEQKLVRFAAPDTQLGAPPAAKSDAATTASGGASKSADAAPKIAWKKVALAPIGAPREAALVLVGSLGNAGVKPYFEDPSWRELSDLGDAGGWVAVEAGTVVWADYEPRYVVLRHYEPPGTYTDHARVDVSANGRFGVVCVDWPQGVTGSKDALVELARAFEPKPAAKP